jgi:2,4-dienoyl-CoA reductase-like NADH-dependent reductase (Old Yellow Enzyme family)
MTTTPLLFQALQVRDLRLRNRIVLPPMCQYSARDGLATDWHEVHYGQFARGGFGAIILEATAITANGRISPGDLGIWSDAHTEALKPVTAFLRQQGTASGVQLAHAGRKASVKRPWHGRGPLDEADAARGDPPWPVIGPSPLAAGEGWLVPKEMSGGDIQDVIAAYIAAARRADTAGFDFAEIHAAHGYLLHSFLSPLSNRRTDTFGGSRENRMRLALEVCEAVRAAWPREKPLFVRISAVDGMDGGWQLEDSIILARELKALGADVIDCSSGGNSSKSATTSSSVPGFQVPYAAAIRREAGIMTQAVGLITSGPQAENILKDGAADLIAIGREALFDPFWSLHQARAMGMAEDYSLWPRQYAYALARRAGALAR